MGHFFNPPQPFIGGRQPSAPFAGLPTGQRVDNPPTRQGGPVALLAEAVAIAQPDPWTYSFMGGRQPYERLKIFADQLAVIVSSQVYVAPGSLSALLQIVTSWQPDPWQYAGMGSQSAYKARQLTPGIPGVSADPPPVTLGGPYALKAEAVQISQPDPWTYSFMGGSAPFLPKPVSAGIPGRSADRPPFTLGGPIAMKALASLIAVPEWGYSTWPYVFMGSSQPYQARTSWIGANGVQVNQPPYTYGGPTFQIQLTASIAQPDPWTFNFDGGAQPYSPRQLAGGLNRQPVDEPPYQLGGPIALKMQTVSITQPDPWIYAFMGQLQPFGRRTLSPGVPGQSVDRPPLTYAGPLAIKLQQASFSSPDWNGATWPYLFMGRTQPYAPRTIPPATAAVIVNNPAFSHPARTAAMAAVMRSWDPPPYDFQMRMYASKQVLLPGALRRPSARGYIIL